MRTPITYYGGKQRLANIIISMMPKHKIYCEPFFGGGAVFFQKPKAGLEVINDKNNMLISFYQVVQNNFEQLQNTLLDTIKRVQENKEYIPQASAINETMKSIIDLEKVKVQTLQLLKA